MNDFDSWLLADFLTALPLWAWLCLLAVAMPFLLLAVAYGWAP